MRKADAWEDFCALGDGVPERFLDTDIKDFVAPGYEGTFQAFSDGWLPRKRSAVLYGPPGKGKTRAMYALIKQVVSRFGIASLRFFNSTELDERFLREFNEFGAIDGLMEAVCLTPFLFVDDFGTERISDRVVRNTQFLIDARWKKRRPLILSTNLLASDVEARYGFCVMDRLRDADWVDFSIYPDWRGQE